MGFMDKAKKLAEQAQQKLDDAQKQWGQNQSAEGQQGAGSVRYDEHGRPIKEAPPAGATPPPSAEPAPAPSDPAAGFAAPAAAEGPETPERPPDEPPPAAQAPHPGGGAESGKDGTADATPDPFKPLQ
jgi:hypothetical protein